MDKWFQRFSARVESYLFYFTVCFIMLLVLIQALMVRGDVRQYLSRVDILEGEPYSYSVSDEKEKYDERPVGADSVQTIFSLTLELSTPGARLSILVNGEEKAILQNTPVTIEVEAGDLIEVEGVTDGEPAVVKITHTTGLKQPAAGEEIILFGENELIGWAIPED